LNNVATVSKINNINFIRFIENKKLQILNSNKIGVRYFCDVRFFFVIRLKIKLYVLFRVEGLLVLRPIADLNSVSVFNLWAYQDSLLLLMIQGVLKLLYSEFGAS
jgi:hypothetical protein